MSNSDLVARYVGNGNQFHGGIPARDLTEADWARLGGGSRRLVKESGLYEMVSAEGENGGGSVTAVSGIGPKTAELLADLGINNLGDLAAADSDELKAAFGPAAAEWPEAAMGLLSG